MSQYLVAPGAVREKTFRLEGEEARHVSRVARARIGDELKLFDGAGSSWRGRIEKIDRGSVVGVVLEELPEAKAPADVRLYLALAARSAFEDALEKTTELGVSELHPILTERSSRFEKSDSPKLERWRLILLAACKQSERARVPELFEPVELERALKDGPGWIAHPGIPSSTSGRADVTRIFIGPEGGFTEAEFERASAAGLQPLSLGTHVLRTETAAVAACARFLLP